MTQWRSAHDSMGEVQVPRDAHYGAQTRRAERNFTISGQRFDRRLIRALGLIKRAAARTNADLGLLPARLAEAIADAATEVAANELDGEFVVDVYQTGSGTSTHVNANEVIASRANELLGQERGATQPVHPSDHVNLGQSSNDVFPTALHLAVATAIQDELAPALSDLAAALDDKAESFDHVLKIGRTHLQDATPIRLGQELSGHAAQARNASVRAEQARDALLEVALGGTAVGTGLNAHPDFASRTIARLARDTGLALIEARNHFEANACRDAAVDASGKLNVIAVSLTKVANDLRWLSSGPRCGLAEIRLPALQPGSSMMPGKVNPVIPEAVLMACARVMGNHVTVTIAGQSGSLQLNVMMPVLAHALLESVVLLGGAVRTLTDRCVRGLEADAERCSALVEQSLALVTALAPAIGHEEAAALASRAFERGLTIREAAAAAGILPPERLAELLDPQRMTEPGAPAGAGG